MFKLKFFVAITLLLVIYTIIKLSYWRNPSINSDNIKCLHECVYKSSKGQKIILTSMSNILEVNFVANSDVTCFNPLFPIIHIKTDTAHNAWIHIVRTDADEKALQRFIDTDKEFTPFYNFNETFYDAPFWYYGIFNKPVSFWEGHAYAVKVDRDAKTITCMGGVKWGFKLPYFSFKPKMIYPEVLSYGDWQKDWLFFSKSLTGYTLNVNN